MVSKRIIGKCFEGKERREGGMEEAMEEAYLISSRSSMSTASGLLSCCIRSLDAASSMRSMALSGMNRS